VIAQRAWGVAGVIGSGVWAAGCAWPWVVTRGWASGPVWDGRLWWAWALLPGFGLLLHVSAYLFEAACVAAVHGDDPAPRPSARALLAAALRESLLALRVFAWRQPWREAAWPDRLPAPSAPPDGRAGVVLVHGYLCNRAMWMAWCRWLTAEGRAFIAPSLQPMLADIDDYAPQLEAAVQRLRAATGRTPVLLGHSMGGLVVRAWWRWRAQRLAAGEPLLPIDPPWVVTLGAPHAGTWLARLGTTLNAQQMRPDSEWLEVLRVQESRDWLARFTCVHSHCDNVVFPPARALLPGATALHRPGLAHLELAHDPGLFGLLRERLAQADQEPAKPATGR
jgi:hypothetical protein